MISGKYYFFWGGECSQWYKAPIVIENVEYNCNEQYMMAEKARLFKDEEALEAIMKNKNPREQKAWGRKVKGFNQAEWEKIARLVVYRANFAKFTQNEEPFTILIATKDLHIVEASPEDVVWGIGMHETDPDILDESKWKGTNWLGEAIMQVRNDIRTTLIFGGMPAEEIDRRAEENYRNYLKGREGLPEAAYFHRDILL